MYSTPILRFISKNWKALLIIALLLAVMGKFRHDYKQLEKSYQITQDSLERQITGLKEIHEREVVRYKKSLDEYRDAIESIENEHRETQAELENQIRINRSTHVKDFSGNRSQLVKDIEETYGFVYVP